MGISLTNLLGEAIVSERDIIEGQRHLALGLLNKSDHQRLRACLKYCYEARQGVQSFLIYESIDHHKKNTLNDWRHKLVIIDRSRSLLSYIIHIAYNLENKQGNKI